jgi:hypothetical protein
MLWSEAGTDVGALLSRFGSAVLFVDCVETVAACVTI